MFLALVATAWPRASAAEEASGEPLFRALDEATRRVEQSELVAIAALAEVTALDLRVAELAGRVEQARAATTAAAAARDAAEVRADERADDHEHTVQQEQRLLVEAYVNGRLPGGGLDALDYDLDDANALAMAGTVGDRFFSNEQQAALRLEAARAALAGRTTALHDARVAQEAAEGAWYATATAAAEARHQLQKAEADLRSAREEVDEAELAIDRYAAELEAQVRRELAAQFAPPPEEPRYGRPAGPRPILFNGPIGPHGIPAVMLSAYESAAESLARSNPGCDARWWALAAIGAVESAHGAIFGSAIDETGRLVDPVVGIALTGRAGTAAIPDTDDGLYDGDRVWDRAVGPMQFIPSTWRAAGLDGNGDGLIDPQNVYDATLSAAAYLCRGAAPGRLSSPTGLAAAAFSYNHSRAYVSKVLDYAYIYSDGALGATRPPAPVPTTTSTTTPPPPTIPPTTTTVAAATED